MTGNLQPLDQKFPIVTPDGRPTIYFIQWAQQKQIDISAGITAEQALAIIELYLADHELQAGTGISISPSGNLSDAPTIAAEVQAILDEISTTQGSILFRGATDWEALAPGTSGQFLKTNGAGADPEWATSGGGGGGTPSVRASNIQSSSSSSYVVSWPTGTVSGDVVLIFVGHGFGVNTPTGWTPLDVSTGSNWNGAVFAKEMDSADITAGSVNITTVSGFNGVVSAVTIDGSTIVGIRGLIKANRSGSGTTSTPLFTHSPIAPDLVIMFASNRAASNNSFSGTSTSLSTINATNASGALSSTSTFTKIGLYVTVSFSSAGSGYYTVAISLSG